MDLFITPKLQFEKTAGEATLPEDPNAWQNEILQELFKQVPYIADFEPHIEMDKLDAERGYGMGHVEVSNKTEMQPGQGATLEGLEASGIKHVKIPIIVKNRRLQPFDIMVLEDGSMAPLTEMRLRSAIFRPSAFDITGKTPGDQSMVNQLYPPVRGAGFGAGNMGGAGFMGKMGSHQGAKPLVDHVAKNVKAIAADAVKDKKKEASILQEILPTILEEDHNRFAQALTDPELQSAYLMNKHATLPSLQKLASWEKGMLPEPHVVPTNVQISKTDQGYVVKTASHRYWAPKSEVWDRGQVCKTFGTKIAFDVDTTGSMTMGLDAPAEPTEAIDTAVDKYEAIKDFGMYKVRTDDGKELVGYVFPNLLDVDGTPLPLFLFTNGSEKAVQGDMVGIPAGSGAALFEGEPRGTGVFYKFSPNGKATATIPLTIVASLSGPGDEGGGVTLHARTFDGRQIEVEVQPNLSNILGVGDEKMIVPDSMSWMPLDGARDVHISTDEESANVADKAASANPSLTIEIRSSGVDSFSLQGMPLSKLASDERSFLSFDAALFTLGAAGVDLKHATEKLAEAQHWNHSREVQATRHIITARQMQEGALKFAAKSLSNVPDLRKDLTKEAAVLPDPTTVDAVLSLGFINPENMSSFIAYLPKLDAAQKKMCELLLASRLGAKDIPSSALEKSIRATEEVIQGLKVIAFQQA